MMIKNGILKSVLIVFAIVGIAFTAYDFYDAYTQRQISAKKIGSEVCLNIKKELDSVFNQTISNSEILAKDISSNSYSKSRLLDTIRAQAERNSFITGVTIAFEPNTYFPDNNLFSLFYRSDQDKFYEIEDFYDYRNDSLETASWYYKPLKTGTSTYIEPYFGVVADEYVIDFAVPIKDPDGNSIGVLSYSLTLNQLAELVRNLVDGSSGYVYLIDQNMDIVAHPNRSEIMQDRIVRFGGSEQRDQLIESLFEKEQGYGEYLSEYTNVESAVFHNTTSNLGWKVAVVYSRTDLLGDPKYLEQRIIHFALAISVLLIFLMLFSLDLEKRNSLWRFAIFSSLLFFGNMVLIWFIQLDIDYSEDQPNRTRVYSEDALSAFLYKRNQALDQIGVEPYQTIPTGIKVNEMVINESYSIGLSGKIWQKWPKNKDMKAPIGFEFEQAYPGGRSIFTTLESKELIDDEYWLYRWNFSAKLRLFLKYQNYPLDQHFFNIRLSYPDPSEDIMLIPDFDSYEVLNPAAKPGLSDLFFVPRFRVIATYFSFLINPVMTFYGKGTKLKTPEIESLEYNVVIKRRFLTPFVAYVIPFVLGAGMIFFLLFSLSNEDDGKAGVTVMGVVQGMAALFFGMLLTHITIRNQIPSPNITYLESFYFIIYALIILLILIVVVFYKNPNHRLLGYKDNVISKVLYWPVLFGLLYLITLIRFY